MVYLNKHTFLHKESRKYNNYTTNHHSVMAVHKSIVFSSVCAKAQKHIKEKYIVLVYCNYFYRNGPVLKSAEVKVNSIKQHYSLFFLL